MNSSADILERDGLAGSREDRLLRRGGGLDSRLNKDFRNRIARRSKNISRRDWDIFGNAIGMQTDRNGNDRLRNARPRRRDGPPPRRPIWGKP